MKNLSELNKEYEIVTEKYKTKIYNEVGVANSNCIDRQPIFNKYYDQLKNEYNYLSEQYIEKVILENESEKSIVFHLEKLHIDSLFFGYDYNKQPIFYSIEATFFWLK